MFRVLCFLSVSKYGDHLMEADALFYFTLDIVIYFVWMHVGDWFSVDLLFFPRFRRKVECPNIFMQCTKFTYPSIDSQKLSHNTSSMTSSLRDTISNLLNELPDILLNIINSYITHAFSDVYWFVIFFLASKDNEVSF